MWTDRTYVLPATFRGQICPRCEPLPYFVPHLTASSIWTYSVSCVPYHLCLALVFGHRPTNRELPCQHVLYCERSEKRWLWGKPFPINPKLSYQSCHVLWLIAQLLPEGIILLSIAGCAKKALIGQPSFARRILFVGTTTQSRSSFSVRDLV